MRLNRRQFIASAVAVSVIPTPTLAAVRKPFVRKGMSVSFLYFEDWSRPHQPQTISANVERIGDWNGSAYPIVLSEYSHPARTYWDGIDSEWCCFREEFPDFSWKNVSSDVYPNIHSYVREKRFGEDPRDMAQRMASNMTAGFRTNRSVIPTRPHIDMVV